MTEPVFGTPEWEARKEARLAVIFAGGRAADARYRRDFTAAAYWQAETDAARIRLCDIIGRPDLAEYWTAYYLDQYGTLPEPAAAA